MKVVLSILMFLYTNLAGAWQQWTPEPIQHCAPQVPYGLPQTDKQIIGICRYAYVTAYDPAAKIPVWTSYTLLPTNALGCLPRTNAFTADASIANGARPDDYTGTGFDRGHVAPDGDMSFIERAELESFLMTNMMPQSGSLNRGIWKLLETSIRGWSVQLNNSFTIYAGPIYDHTSKTIGNGVVVPNAFYKIVTNNQTGEVAGWLFPHSNTLGRDLTKLRASVEQIETASGVRFSFPDNAVEIVPGKEWPVNFGKLTASKQAACKR